MRRRKDDPDLIKLAGSALRLARELERGLDEALTHALADAGHGSPGDVHESGGGVPADDGGGVPALSGREYLILRLVQDGVSGPSEVARELNLPPANVSRATGRLVEVGLLERAVDPADLRRAVLRLTVTGEATVDYARERVAAWLRELFGGASDDWLAVTQQRLARLVEHASAPAAPPSPA